MKIGQKGENLIFLISQPRSGSTMLQRILGNHHDIYTVSEPWLMVPPLVGLTCRWSSPEGREARFARENVRRFLETFPGGRDDYFEGLRRMYVYLYNRALENSGKRYFLDKTPRYAYFIPELYRVFPEARYIFLLRNPLAVLCSIVTNWTGYDKRTLSTDHNDDLVDVPRLLLEGMNILDSKAIKVHYERLVSQPDAEIRRICENIGVGFYPEIIEYNAYGLPQWCFGDQFVYKHTAPDARKSESWKAAVRDPRMWGFAYSYLGSLGKDLVEHLGYSYRELHGVLQNSRPHWLVRGLAALVQWPRIRSLYGAVKSVIRKISSFFTLSFIAVFFMEPFFWFLGLRGKNRDVGAGSAKRILVVRLDSIGDLVLTTPFLRELRRNSPGSFITLIVDPRALNLVDICPYVDEVLTYDWRARGSFKKLKKCFRAVNFSAFNLWEKRFDLAITPRWGTDYYHGSFLAYISGARDRIGYSEYTSADKRRLNRGYDNFITHLITDGPHEATRFCGVSDCGVPFREAPQYRWHTVKHEVVRNLDVIKFLGREPSGDDLELWIEDSDKVFAGEILRKYEVKSGEALVCFGVGSQEPKKIWPIGYFADLGAWLIKEYGVRILLLGNEQEKPLGERMEKDLKEGPVINMIGNTTLRRAAALIKHCKAYIGNDNGLMHISAAMGIPVVEASCWPKSGSLFGEDSPCRFGPWKVKNIVVSSQKIAGSKDNGISRVTVEEMKKAVREILSS
ncbi:MAG: hypothetical protein A2Z72_06010 [Omnitrophica bacterium RBG_13_46_9]|nr:MAG: hypothetical protein A2Z72_06010 [Omnitrophica bacterium RBG_13_46_9]